MEALFRNVEWHCAVCGKPSGTCDCWATCPSCGGFYRTGTQCDNPVHGIEAAAKEMAQHVARTVIDKVRHLYPEPMKQASDGFRRTLKSVMEQEFSDALAIWMKADAEERKRLEGQSEK